ncbi:hypothetical protein INR49_026463 [Caranx melampygus]|nr:hypothetical protein INR49_026463 [Caranx melampygus]
MNKQPSKESLKDKVKGIFGLGPPRPPSKQSDTKPSEFIITTDIIKELHPDCGLSNRVRMMNHVCDLAKTKKFEEVSMHRVTQWRQYGKLWRTCCLQSSHMRPDMLYYSY